MGLIKEPLNVDFYFDGRQMTTEDQQRVTEYIQNRIVQKKKRLDSSRLVAAIEDARIGRVKKAKNTKDLFKQILR